MRHTMKTNDKTTIIKVEKESERKKEDENKAK